MTAHLRIRVYGAVLAALVIIFVLGMVFGPRRGQSLGMVFPGFETATVEEVRIEGESAVTLRREGESWVLDEGSRQFPARADRLDTLLSAAADSAVIRRITASERLWPDFGLTDEEGTLLRFNSASGDGALSSVVWGDNASEPGLSYFRRPDAPDVYATDGQLGFYLDQPASYWSYLRVLPEDVTPAAVIGLSASVNMTLGEEEELVRDYRITRTVTDGAESWVADGPDLELDAEAVLRSLRDVTDLVGRDFSRATQLGGGDAVGSIEIALADGREFGIELRALDDGAVCVASGPALPGDPFGGLAYEITGATVRRLFPEVSSLAVE